MRHRTVSQQPFKLIVDREWKRAKRILPMLRQRQKPKVIWKTASQLSWRGWNSYRSGIQGTCNRSTNIISMHEGYLKHQLHKEFVLTLRHEIAHLLRPSGSQYSHGKDFIWWMKKLGGTRYCTDSIENLAKKK